jgi:hypothetical protein
MSDQIIEPPAYKVRLTRLDDGREQHIDIDYYGVLRELLAELETMAEKRGWFEESDPPAPGKGLESSE